MQRDRRREQECRPTFFQMSVAQILPKNVRSALLSTLWGCSGRKKKKKKKNPSRLHYGFSTAILGLLRVWVTGVAHNTIMV